MKCKFCGKSEFIFTGFDENKNKKIDYEEYYKCCNCGSKLILDIVRCKVVNKTQIKHGG